jgi:hypothetical protein
MQVTHSGCWPALNILTNNCLAPPNNLCIEQIESE